MREKEKLKMKSRVLGEQFPLCHTQLLPPKGLLSPHTYTHNHLLQLLPIAAAQHDGL